MATASETSKLRMRERYRALRDAGLCPQCGKAPQGVGRIMCDSCNANRLRWHADNRERSNAKSAEYRRRLKSTVLSAYGAVCACCGETRPEFLTIDHVEGGGRRHRATFKSPVQFWKWVVDSDFPENLRVLCMNCNLSFGVYGYCPHQRERGDPCTRSTRSEQTKSR